MMARAVVVDGIEIVVDGEIRRPEEVLSEALERIEEEVEGDVSEVRRLVVGGRGARMEFRENEVEARVVETAVSAGDGWRVEVGLRWPPRGGEGWPRSASIFELPSPREVWNDATSGKLVSRNPLAYSVCDNPLTTVSYEGGRIKVRRKRVFVWDGGRGAWVEV